MTTSFSKLIQITRKKTLNYNDKGRSTHRMKSLQTKIDLHFFREMKDDEIKSDILQLI